MLGRVGFACEKDSIDDRFIVADIFESRYEL